MSRCSYGEELRDEGLKSPRIHSRSELDCTQTVRVHDALEIQNSGDSMIRFSNSAEG